ncbi:MAG: 3'-5' exonuclease [Prevotellaceae bacterium]|jgi:DNA polymerase-3 subunit epsilon|nr:3'-5' exonuclease [Prevotellaceae bacterium]
MSKLNLTNPLVFFDLETTGVNTATDRIVELTYLKVEPNGIETSKTMKINPQMHIPEEASKVHGIYDDDVKDCPVFADIAPAFAQELRGCDIAGFNSNKFDIPLLADEFIRANVDIDLKKSRFVDVMVIFYKMEQRTLSAAYKFYCNKDLENAHSSEADTMATYNILLSQLERYPSLGSSVEALSEFSTQTNNVDFAGRVVYDDNKREIFNFGKHKGRLVSDVFKFEPSYYTWIMQGDFSLYTKKVLTEIRFR